MAFLDRISDNLYRFRDTCNVYVIRSGSEAALVDFGSGDVLDALPGIGVRTVTDVLMTHHHRDQGQGLSRLPSGARLWAPHAEQDLFHSVDEHWQARAIRNNYDVRQDRFSLLNTVDLHGTLKDYSHQWIGGRDWQVIPTPGHTPGSITLLVSVDGRLAAFTGDLIAGPGKVWSMAAMQWSYHGMEGASAAVPALMDLLERSPDLLLPSHGDLMDTPACALADLRDNLLELLSARGENPSLMNWAACPYERVSPHLLRNRTSVSNSYVLISNSGNALLIDYGYDFLTAFFFGGERALHRPWLYTIDRLKREYGIRRIDAVVATHYHDDHVAGFNLLREVEGARVWAADQFADVLEEPGRYDLPCLWYDPIPVDVRMPEGQPMHWEEYTLTAYPLTGHTRYAAAIAFAVDGMRVLATGDQYKHENGLGWNYVYQNGFDMEDYRASAALYRRLQPDLILPGHWQPLRAGAEYFRALEARGEQLERLHRNLLANDGLALGAYGIEIAINPYHCEVKEGMPVSLRVEVRSRLDRCKQISIQMHLPEGWRLLENPAPFLLHPGETGVAAARAVPPIGATGRRFRIAADCRVEGIRFGQLAEALIDLT